MPSASLSTTCSNGCKATSVFYLDDDTPGDSLEGALRDFNTVEQLVRELRLEVNQEMSELICDDSPTKKVVPLTIPSLRVVDQEHVSSQRGRVGG